ncbi:MAG: transcriptional regulator [Lachnospiraceae bacterium]|nr:transcriptional regulator [Lachnospiraceae bacterium]
MGETLPVLNVRLFGKEKITYGSNIVLYGRNSVTKGMRLLLILFYYGKRGINRNILLESLYGEDDLSDAANNLRVTIHRLKKMLLDAGLPEHDYIYYKGGNYYWDSPMETQVDTDLFRELIREAEEEESRERKIAILSEACSLYRGDFLQRAADMEWVLTEALQFKNMYTNALSQLCDMLMEEKKYVQALKYADAACKIYPFDEWQIVKIDCYMGLNRYQDAIKEYEAAARLFVEELGIAPSQKMKDRFAAMNENIGSRPKVISEIKEGLNDEMEERGALFCSFPGFQDAYRIVKRGMERSGQSVCLLVCSIVDSEGRPMKVSDKLDEMAGELYSAIQNSLRKSDAFTKYNRAQFLVMLVGTNRENSQIAIDRIVNQFTIEHKSWKKYIECSISSLLDEEE